MQPNPVTRRRPDALLRLVAVVVGLQVWAVQGAESRSWQCQPIDPASPPAEAPCFRALHSGDNRVELQWRVTGALERVYLYDDFGVTFEDPGWRPARCADGDRGLCRVEVRVPEGGYYRWVLSARNAAGERAHARAAVDVPRPPAPRAAVSGGAFADPLKPAPRRLAWEAGTGRAPCPGDNVDAWIEVQYPESSLWTPLRQRARCGPQAGLDIAAADLAAPGTRHFGLRDCYLPAGSAVPFCGAPVTTGLHITGDRFLALSPLHAASGQDLTIRFTTRSGDYRRIRSTTLPLAALRRGVELRGPGQVTIPGGILSPGRHDLRLESCTAAGRCTEGAALDILVDDPVRWELRRDYREDFHEARAVPVLGPGEPLDIVWDSDDGIWLVNEFSTGLEHIAANGAARSYTVPLGRRSAGRDQAAREATRPFAWAMGGKLVTTHMTALGERVTEIGETIWFTQGGGLLRADEEPSHNHSRVVAFRRGAKDRPHTFYDDRFCVYNLPAGESGTRGDNQVIGLERAAGRIWVAESRGLFSAVPSALSSFIPDKDLCGNLVVFEEPGELDRQPLQFCRQGQAPERDGCMARRLLDALPRSIRVAHLAADPVDGRLWFTDARGGYLGRLDPHAPEADIDIFHLPDNHTVLTEDMDWFRGFPWALRVDNQAVYIGEYNARHVIRFDKGREEFSEIPVPAASPEIRLHSIDLDAASQRLWFTLTNESPLPLDRQGSTLGYVDLDAWTRHLSDPDAAPEIPAVLYDGLHRIPPSAERPLAHQAFRGIAVNPRSGAIALATMYRRQVVELRPREHLRPRALSAGGRESGSN